MCNNVLAVAETVIQPHYKNVISLNAILSFIEVNLLDYSFASI